MHGDTAWISYLPLLAFYLIFETIYHHFNHRFFATQMLEELVEVIRKIKFEMESDKEGARLCAWGVAIILILSPIFIVGFSIASMVKHDSAKDAVTCLILLIFLVPFTFLIKLINELCMSWIKKIRTH